MNDEEHVPQARTPAAADAEKTSGERLEALGVRGILWQLARDGQIVDVRCEMPQCYCFRGRSYFDPKSTLSEWSPTADHRDPLCLETSQPGVFVAGDLRHGSTKRVASAVGEGAMAASLVHSFLDGNQHNRVTTPCGGPG